MLICAKVEIYYQQIVQNKTLLKLLILPVKNKTLMILHFWSKRL